MAHKHPMDRPVLENAQNGVDGIRIAHRPSQSATTQCGVRRWFFGGAFSVSPGEISRGKCSKDRVLYGHEIICKVLDNIRVSIL